MPHSNDCSHFSDVTFNRSENFVTAEKISLSNRTPFNFVVSIEICFFFLVLDLNVSHLFALFILNKKKFFYASSRVVSKARQQAVTSLRYRCKLKNQSKLN